MSLGYEGYIKVGDTYFTDGDFAQAIEIFAALLNEGVRNSRMFLNLASSYEEQLEYEKAIEVYQKYLQYFPQDDQLPIVRRRWADNCPM